MSEITTKFLGCEVKSVDAKNRRLRALGSTASVDRDGERVEPGAFKATLDSYRKNPVIVASHVYRSADGTPTVIGHAKEIEATEAGLPFTMQFAETPLAEQYWSLYRDGHMRAFSVGFIPRAWRDEPVDPQQPMMQRRRTFTEVELLEISAVAVPSNREALVLAAGSGNGAAQKILDQDEFIRRAAKAAAEEIGLEKVVTRIDEIMKDKLSALDATCGQVAEVIEELRGDLADPGSAYARGLLDSSGKSCGHGADDPGLTGKPKESRAPVQSGNDALVKAISELTEHLKGKSQNG